MLARVVALVVAFFLTVTTAEARRVALVIGQNAYPGGTTATIGLPPLSNPKPDARLLAELLARRGFEVIACDGKTPGCFDLDRDGLLDALMRLELRAAGADLALVFFAGHGMATEEGNILTPVDAKVDCATGAVTWGVPVERIMAATTPARMKLLILDACRDNPLDDVCPSLKKKKLAFTRIETGAMQGVLLVTSTQFGQSALDGLPGAHSPFATALFATLAANSNIYFEQVFNEVARATFDAAQKQGGFLQIPGKVVGGVAPADCLAGKDCVGDARMAALAIENERLTKDAAGVRNIIEREEAARSKPYTGEERQKRVAELEATLENIGTSTDPLRQEARRLIDDGNVAGGQAKLDEALEADEKALAEAERVAAARRIAAARSARDLAVLARGTDVIKAVAYYERATRLDASDPQLWLDYGNASLVAGRTLEAETALNKAVLIAGDANNLRVRFWGTLRLGDVAVTQGKLRNARDFYQAATTILEPFANGTQLDPIAQSDLADLRSRIGDVLRAQGDLSAALHSYHASLAIAEHLAKIDPSNVANQLQLVVAHERIGDVFDNQGNLAAALESYRAAHAINERLAKADPGNAGLQRGLTVSLEKLGGALETQGKLAEALENYHGSFAIIERLAKADPSNAGWQRDLSVSHNIIGNALQAQGKLAEALHNYRASFTIIERLAKADPSNAGWQRDLSGSHEKIGSVVRGQGAIKAAQEFLSRHASGVPGLDFFPSFQKISEVNRVAQGELAEALESYRAALVIKEQLAKADPSNADWQRDLSVSHDTIGDILVAQGKWAEALKSYRASQAIAERLAKADPSNANWQRDLSVSHNNIGDALRAQGKLAEALHNYRASFAIIERLIGSRPGNADWQNDLSTSHEKIGDLLVEQGELSAALQGYTASLANRVRLANAAPDKLDWQAGCAATYGGMGQLLVRMKRNEEALDMFLKGRAIIAPLVTAAPEQVLLWNRFIASFDREIGALTAPSGATQSGPTLKNSLKSQPRPKAVEDWKKSVFER